MRVVFALAAIALWLALVGFFYPGLMNVDSGELLSQAVAGAYVDWHSPLLSLIWARLDRLAAGPASLLAAGSALYVLGAAWTAANLARGLPMRLLCLLVLCCWPPLLNDLGLVGRDSAFIACFMLYVGLLTSGRANWPALLALLLAGMAFRPDSAIAMVPGLALPWGFRLRTAIVGIAAFVLCYAAMDAVNHQLLQARRTFPIQTTLIHDLGGISYRAGEDLMPAYADYGFDMEQIRQRYTPRFGDPLMFAGGQPNVPISFDADHHKALQTAWMAAVGQHPIAYLRHRVATFRALLDLDLPADYQLYQPDTDPHLTTQFPRLDGMDLSNPDHPAIRFYRERLMPWLIGGPLFRGYFYDGVIVLQLLLALHRRRNTELALGTGALLHQGVLFLASPAALFRYFYPSVLVAIAMTLLSLSPYGSARSAVSGFASRPRPGSAGRR